MMTFLFLKNNLPSELKNYRPRNKVSMEFIQSISIEWWKSKIASI